MTAEPIERKPSSSAGCSRRRFLRDAGTAAVAFSVMSPERVRGSAQNTRIDLGMVGCGGRATWLAELFRQHGGYNLVAAADYFQERVDAFGDKAGVPTNRRFTGLSGYRRLLEQKLDAVVIVTPPYFHPLHALDAVDAGKHVYIAKPVAVDVPGCRIIEEASKKATTSRLCFLVDFQARVDALFVEAVRRVHAGAIGRFAFGEATYHGDDPFLGVADHARSGSPEGHLRAWGLSRELSGDIITEQNIHCLDVTSWLMREPPLRASGTGGRKFRDAGSCWDTFTVTFHYPGDVGVAFSSRQFNAHGTKPDGIRNRIFGSEGVFEAEYGGQVLIRGRQFYRGGRTPQIYLEGAVSNVAAFHDAIGRGDYTNQTVPESVRSNLVTILGRTAAYEGRVVTWDEMLRRAEPLVPDLTGLKE